MPGEAVKIRRTGNPALDEMHAAAHQAIQEMGGASGMPVIHKALHRQAMKNLTPQEMQALVQQFGAPAVMSYLRRLT